MTEHDVMEIIQSELRRSRMPVPVWMTRPEGWTPERLCWVRICRRIADTAYSEQRAAARAASMAGYAVLRGRKAW